MINKEIGEIASTFLALLDSIKIYHWQTKIYSRHKASDSLHESLAEKVDKFIEVMQGSRNDTLKFPKQPVAISNMTDSSIIILLNGTKVWLENTLSNYLRPTDTELYNIRDEMLADINQALYLFSLE